METMLITELEKTQTIINALKITLEESSLTSFQYMQIVSLLSTHIKNLDTLMEIVNETKKRQGNIDQGIKDVA